MICINTLTNIGFIDRFLLFVINTSHYWYCAALVAREQNLPNFLSINKPQSCLFKEFDDVCRKNFGISKCFGFIDANTQTKT